jgi:hypothetical protein
MKIPPGGKVRPTSLAVQISAQKPPESGAKSMRFPFIIRHRKAEARIYGKSKNYPFYRVDG